MGNASRTKFFILMGETTFLKLHMDKGFVDDVRCKLFGKAKNIVTKLFYARGHVLNNNKSMFIFLSDS